MTKVKGKKTKTTNIYFVLDRSGSMSSMAAEAIGGFNSFVIDQQKLQGKANLTLVQFDDKYEIIHNAVPVADVPTLTDQVYSPRGMTALYDAVGKTIATGIAQSKAGEKNILVVLTDGQENASQEYNNFTLNAAVKRAQDELDWTVIFLGANMDAKHVASTFGIASKNVSTFDATKGGAQAAMSTVSFAASAYRNRSMGVVGSAGPQGPAGVSMDDYLDNNAIDLSTVYANVKADPTKAKDKSVA